ncbi:MAG: hypothetical protein GX838_04005 [Clostridiaceae bacterium]|nr:hypothetical protein [Clostridiaceae bacterium]
MTVMLLEASIPLSVLLYVVLGLAGTVALVALIIFLFKAAAAAGHIGKLVREISPDLEKTVEKLPSTVGNIEIISGNLVDVTDELADFTPGLLDDVEAVLDALGSTTEALSSVITGLTDGVSSLFGGKRRKPAGSSTTQQILTIAGALLGLMNKGRDKDTAKKKKKKKKK